MNNVNKTLYIPLYGKALVSSQKRILNDPKAESIWEKEKFELKGKSKTKWLAYYMGMRSRVFDEWVQKQVDETCVVLHLGCGLDSRVLRVKHDCMWIDVDFESVLDERKKYYEENDLYKMISSDLRENWYSNIDYKKAIVVIEGVSMYLKTCELQELLNGLCSHFENVSILLDYYTEKAAKLSKIKNPINDVGVFDVYGFDDPKILESENVQYIGAHEITPSYLIDELEGLEKTIFKKMYAGKLSNSLYRMAEYRKK